MRSTYSKNCVAGWSVLTGRTLAFAAIGLTLLLPISAARAQQKALLEKSASYALDNKFRAFRVPVLDSTGKVKYFDVTVTLNVAANGTLGTSATVQATASPNITTLVVPPGSYRAPDGTTCSVANINLANGRVQSTFDCARSAVQAQFAVATGPVASGHPFLAHLQSNGIDQLPEVTTKTWGPILSASSSTVSINGCSYFATTNQDQSVGAVTNGSVVSVALYRRNVFQCGVNLTKQ
ncbi:MAG: hypothetical protein U1E45_14570 [Geminicoccaceae bacterium]